MPLAVSRPCDLRVRTPLSRTGPIIPTEAALNRTLPKARRDAALRRSGASPPGRCRHSRFIDRRFAPTFHTHPRRTREHRYGRAKSSNEKDGAWHNHPLCAAHPCIESPRGDGDDARLPRARELSDPKPGAGSVVGSIRRCGSVMPWLSLFLQGFPDGRIFVAKHPCRKTTEMIFPDQIELCLE